MPSAPITVQVTAPAPPPVPITVLVSAPGGTSVRAGQTLPFTAAVEGTANLAVVWEVNGTPGGNMQVGTILGAANGTAVYTAPGVVPANSAVTVSAVSTADPTKSGGQPVSILNPQPVIASVLPASLTEGTTTLTLGGSGFVSGSQIVWNGAPVATTLLSATQLKGVITASEPGTYTLAVSNPAPGASTSAQLTEQVGPASVHVVLAAPGGTAVRTGGNLMIIALVTGTANTGLVWQINGVTGGNAQFGTITSTSSGAATYTAPALVPAPNNTVTITATSTDNPADSGTIAIAVLNPVPVLNSLNPTSLAQSATPAALTLIGQNFVPGTQVLWNSAPVPSLFVSSTHLLATVPVAQAGTDTVTVSNPNPGSAVSSPLNETVTVSSPAQNPTVVWPAPAAITYGVALSATQLDATASVPGSFLYSPAAGAVLAAGTQTLSVTLMPTGGGQPVTQSTTLLVNKATPSLSWPAPAAIPAGTALSSMQLDATASVAGKFTYAPPADTVLQVGNQTLNVSFAPNDSADYNAATSSVQLTVNSPLVTWPAPAAITYGTALSSAQLDATASVPGTFAYSPIAGTVLSAGTQTLSVTFTPAAGGQAQTQTTTLVVSRATPSLSWPTPAAVPAGTALSATQLDATSSVAGTFSYAPPAGTVLQAGSQTLTVSFTPNDINNYTSASGSVQLTVKSPIVADCTAYSYSDDKRLCQVNSVAAPNAIAVRVSPSPNSPNQPIQAMTASGAAVTVYLSAITTQYFAPVSYTWSQVSPVIDSYASKAIANLSSKLTSTPQVTVSLSTSGIYQFQVTATDAGNKTVSNYVWVNVWDAKPGSGTG